MDMLWKTNDNLMELLSSRYTFGDAVQRYRQQKNADQTLTLHRYLEDSYASPAIKRAIHQAIGIVSEVQSVMKAPPKRIFVEMAREEGKKGRRTLSRKAELVQLYQKCGEECNALFAQLDAEPEEKLRRDKLYLYYTQKGRCMYSEESINLAKLDSDYDIDHIYPQSKTKDDSLTNRVLVKRELNAQKADAYPIAPEVRHARGEFWKELKEKGLISREKYDRLVRADGFTLEEQAGFISRQLVETRQSSKIVAELLQRRFGDATEIVYVKAGNVSSFRQNQRLDADGHQKQAWQCKNKLTEQDPVFVKCREVNDFHHAKDAYLNIVVGNVYHVKFTRNPANFLREKNVQYSLNKMFAKDVSRGGEWAWKWGDDGSIAAVRDTMRKNNILVTYKTYEKKGQLFEQTLAPAKEQKIPVKRSDPRMATGNYGGYSGCSVTYFFLVEHTKGKKRIREIEAVNLIDQNLYETDPEVYCKHICGLKEPKILISKIKVNELFSYDGYRMRIASKDDDTRFRYKNATSLVLLPEWNQYMKQISKYRERCRQAMRELPVTEYDHITREKNIQLYEMFIEKMEKTIYKNQFQKNAELLKRNLSQYGTLSLEEQTKVLMEILRLFGHTTATADLKLLAESGTAGKLRLSKNISGWPAHKVELIRQSCTGIFEQKVDLLGDFSK